MKKLLKYKSYFLILADVLIIPGVFFFRWLSGIMLTGIDDKCIWTYFGGQCVTCGGTHFINDLFSGKIITAYYDNQFLFLCLILIVLVYLLLHLYLWFNFNFAKKILRYIFSIPFLIVFLSVMLIFLMVRNIPAFINIIELIKSKI